MHEIQKKLLALAEHDDLSRMSFRKIGERIGVEHAAQVRHHLNQLVKNGYLTENSEGKLTATETIPKKNFNLMSIPFMGEADCGEATKLATGEIQGYLTISPKLTRCTSPKDLFALKARGDSMDRADIGGKAISDSDYVLVKECDASEITDGDYAVSLINGLANIKKIQLDRANQRIVLTSESHRYYPPIIISADDIEYYQIAGKVVDVIKGIDTVK